MVETILEPARCDGCGQFMPAPDDGQWRYAKSGKVHDTFAEAAEAADSLNRRDSGFEYRAVVDDVGRARIASRRRPASE